MKKPLLFTLLLIFVIGMFSNVYAQVNVTIGSGTSTNTTTGAPAPYGTYWKNFRQQFLLLATEIEDAGGGAGNINSVAFNVANLNTCSPMPNYTIRLKHTTQTTLSTTFEAGDYQTVFTQAEYMPVVGWNTHTFTTPFVWDGTSNILVDIYTSIIPGDWTQNASVITQPPLSIVPCASKATARMPAPPLLAQPASTAPTSGLTWNLLW